MNHTPQWTMKEKNMTIKFERPEEAFASIAWIVVAADKHGSIEQRNFLYQQVKDLDIFKNYSRVEFSQLLGATFVRICQIFPNGDSSGTGKRINSLISSVNKVLSPKLRMEAFKMAVGLAYADGLCNEEKILLEHFQQGFAINEEMTQEILETETTGKV